MTSGPRRLRFYFDYISSNAYLAWADLPRLCDRYQIAVEPVPTLFAGLLEAHGQLGPAEVPAKALWMWKNCLRKAAVLHVPLRPARFHPFNPLLALRASSLAMAEEQRFALIDGLFRAVWADRLHVSEPSVVEQVANAAGLDGARVVAEAQAPAAKARLRAQTDAAIAAGVFGVPTAIVGGEIFWGYDDHPWLERHLAGNDPLDPTSVPDAETRPPPSAMRRRFRDLR